MIGYVNPIDHLESCAGCVECDGLMENGWQTCDVCGQWGNYFVGLPPGIAVCDDKCAREAVRLGIALGLDEAGRDVRST